MTCWAPPGTGVLASLIGDSTRRQGFLVVVEWPVGGGLSTLATPPKRNDKERYCQQSTLYADATGQRSQHEVLCTQAAC